MRNQNVEFEDNGKKGRNIGVVVVALVAAAALAICAVQIYTLSQKLDAMQQRLNDVEEAAKLVIWSSEFWMDSETEMPDADFDNAELIEKVYEEAAEYDKEHAKELLQKAKEILIAEDK